MEVLVVDSSIASESTHIRELADRLILRLDVAETLVIDEVELPILRQQQQAIAAALLKRRATVNIALVAGRITFRLRRPRFPAPRRQSGPLSVVNRIREMRT